MGVRTVKTAALTAQRDDSTAPARFRQPGSRLPSRAIVLSLLLSLAVAWVFSSARVAQAGWTDWFSSSDSQGPKTKKPVKKAGINQSNKKPTTATCRMLDSMTSAPKKMVTSSMSALLPGKKTTTSKSRTVPRKLVSEQKPSMLKQLFTDPKKKDPLTVNEWMSQPRPKP